ncbi:hypothetical protein PG326_00600 [Riemerella anatipestifer]|nr:hypothetical protein [Riemerella anatipestifer]MDY3356834.1 hypothetical protein [Riemerella anatipestifer]
MLVPEKEAKQIRAIIEYNVGSKSLATIIRRFTHETVRMSFVVQEKDCSIEKDWLSEGYYFLTELCEILDPQLEDDN